MATVLRPRAEDDVSKLALPPGPLVARGLGRSYGDAAQIDRGTVIDMTACGAIEPLGAGTDEPATLVVRCQAGVSIGQLIDRFVPSGWFVPVTPGTRHVTVGGAIAADIHGKNHHLDGTFGSHVRRIRLRLADDRIVDVAPDSDPWLFWATVGGMGLTGLIIDADVALTRIQSSQVMVETSRYDDLGSLCAAMVASDADHRFSVAWVDLLNHGRGVLTQGSFAHPDDLAPHPAGRYRLPNSPNAALPPLPPMRLVRTPAVRALNELWWRRAPSNPETGPQSITAFFHPLDAIRDWNRAYGPAGLVQWQCVVPDGFDLLAELTRRFSRLPCCLSVLKRFGDASPAPLSFPRPGWTLAVDLPASAAVLDALAAIDELVADGGGRLYLAKDARTTAAMVQRTYPGLDEWRDVRRRVDPHRRWRSDLGDRLGL